MKIADYANVARKTLTENSLKETGIGSVPEDWAIAKFEQTISKKRFKIGKIKKRDYEQVGKYPVIDQSQNFIAGFTDDYEKVYQGDLPIVIFGDHTRIFKFIDFPFVIGADGVKVILPKKGVVNPLFFYYALSNLRIQSRGYNRHYPLLREKVIPIPPLPEQQKIARVLSIIQRAVEQQDKIIEAAKNLKKSLMQKLFTEGLGHTEFKKKEIGEIPVSWEVKKLGDVAEVKTSTSSLASVKECESSEPTDENSLKILYLKVADLNLPINTCYIVDSKEHFQIKKEAVNRLNVVPPSSVVFPKRGGAISTNKKRITRFFSLLDPNLVAVIPSEEINATFLYQWFQTFDLLTIADKTPIPQLNKKDVEPVNIPFPPLPEQQEIARILGSVDEKIEVEERRKVTLNELFKTMLHELMTGKIRSKDVEV
jgi:type I restriction enzyme S subunit